MWRHSYQIEFTIIEDTLIVKEEYDSSFDEYPSRYILISEDYKKFKSYFLKNEKKISVIMEKYKAPIQADPFSNLDESDLPF